VTPCFARVASFPPILAARSPDPTRSGAPQDTPRRNPSWRLPLAGPTGFIFSLFLFQEKRKGKKRKVKENLGIFFILFLFYYFCYFILSF